MFITCRRQSCRIEIGIAAIENAIRFEREKFGGLSKIDLFEIKPLRIRQAAD